MKPTREQIGSVIRGIQDAGCEIASVEQREDGALIINIAEPGEPSIASEALDPYADRSGTIYVAGFDRWVKIGFTRGGVPKRLAAIQTPLPMQLYGEFKGTVAVEFELHSRFCPWRENGEWFRKEGDLAAWIEAGCPL